jgi:hypothetical protein
MRVFLRGGKFDGKFREIPESDRQFVEDGQVYMISPDKTNEGTQVFKFDNVATEKRKAGKVEPTHPAGKVEPTHPAGKVQPTDRIGGKGEPMQMVEGKVEPAQKVQGKVAGSQPKQRS